MPIDNKIQKRNELRGAMAAESIATRTKMFGTYQLVHTSYSIDRTACAPHVSVTSQLVLTVELVKSSKQNNKHPTRLCFINTCTGAWRC